MEQLDDARVRFPDRELERASAVLRSRVAVSSAFEKQPRDGLMIEMHRGEKSGPACRWMASSSTDMRPRVEQSPRHFEMAMRGCRVQRQRPFGVASRDIRSSVEKQFHNVDPARDDRRMQWRLGTFVRPGGIDSSPGIQEQPDGVWVTVPRRVVQRGDSDRIGDCGIRTVIQEKPNTICMAILRHGMQRSRSVHVGGCVIDSAVEK
ncbi:hypothetical protein VD0004_g8530 [Verticillium dahliae]|uniref:Uncharacterized protein n=1 Tax=Verticillium dahliae TaxID=27337 RepID=A0A444S4J8_VERDA|nr:hypothetical protein VD0004_g8530 [Verticillium dahliae]RXG48337.1 hypothetical protein VDGE_30100 [Verticillium dahliae]